VVPCHRVVAVNGLGGFCGSKNKNSKKLQIKQWLLEHEKKDGARR
jgi:methylated-DNA-[protein]-cysteine S-methyltransferase